MAAVLDYLTLEDYWLQFGLYPNLLTETDSFANGTFPVYRGPGHASDTATLSGVAAEKGYNSDGYFTFTSLGNGGIYCNTGLGTMNPFSTRCFDFYIKHSAALDDQYLVTTYTGSSAQMYLRIQDNGSIKAHLAKTGDSMTCTSTTNLTDGQEARISLTIVGNQIKLYVDGVLESSDNGSTSDTEFTSPLVVGYYPYSEDGSFGGRIYTFQYWGDSNLGGFIDEMHTDFDGYTMDSLVGTDNGDGTMAVAAYVAPEPAKKVGNFITPSNTGNVGTLPNQMKILNDRRLRQRHMDQVKVLTYK